MWKKDEGTPDEPQQAYTPPRSDRPAPAPSSAGPATIGPSITIRGEVSGDEDLLIQGRVDGSVELELHTVTVGGEGRVKANVTARVVTVEGEVEGDLKAREQVILKSASRVKGDITAPRVVLEDGANFRGLVDMGEPETGSRSSADAGTAKGGREDRTGSSSSSSPRSSAADTTTSKDAGSSKASSSSGGASSGGSGSASGAKEKAAS